MKKFNDEQISIIRSEIKDLLMEMRVFGLDVKSIDWENKLIKNIEKHDE